MNITIVMPLGDQRGGAELALWNLLEHGRGPRITWQLIFFEDGPLAEQARGLGLDVAIVPAARLRSPLQVLKTIRQIARVLQQQQADAVLSWMTKAHLYGGPAAHIAKIPALWYQHGISPGRDWMAQAATFLPAQGILACSQQVAEWQQQMRPQRSVRVVYPGVELARFDPARLPTPRAAREQLKLSVEGPVIGIVGRLQRWKGMHTLIAALPRVLQDFPHVQCVIVGGEHFGEPKYRAELEKQIVALALDSRVCLVGLQRDVPLWMQAMDVVVHASDNEPFGIVVVEAMALGKPLVGGARGGPAEIIHPGVEGLLTRYEDVEGLANALLRYLQDPAFALQTGQAARRRSLDFSTQCFARNVIESVLELLQTKQTRESERA